MRIRACWSIIFFVLTFFVVSCSSPVEKMNHQSLSNSKQALQQAEVQNAQKNQAALSPSLPPEVLSNLSPNFERQVNQSQEKRFDVVVKDLSADQFFLNLVADSGENIIVSPGIADKITLHLKKVTLLDVLRAVKLQYGIEYQRTSFGYQVGPRKIETRVFYLSHPNVIQASESRISVSEADLETTSKNGAQNNQASGASLTTKFGKETFWDEVSNTINSIVKNDSGSYAQTNPNTGAIVVAAYSDTLEKVAAYLQAIQEINDQQVIIDAKIIELTLAEKYQTGINWSQVGLNVSSTTGIFNVTNPISATNIDSVVTLLSQQGSLTVLSNPRLSVTNNRPALIKVGNDNYYVTSVNSGTTPVGTTATVSSNVTLSPFFSGIALDVIPTIMPNGFIKLQVHPLVSLVKQVNQNITLSDTQQMTLPLASTDIREANSSIEMQSGQVVVLGGLMQHVDQLSANSFAGSAWSQKHPLRNDQGAVTELVILLKASITKPDVWINEIKATSKRYDQLGDEHA